MQLESVTDLVVKENSKDNIVPPEGSQYASVQGAPICLHTTDDKQTALLVCVL